MKKHSLDGREPNVDCLHQGIAPIGYWLLLKCVSCNCKSSISLSDARFILKLCKEVRANERPRRFTAEQAGVFLSQLLEDQPSDNVTSSDSDWSGEEENDRSR